MTNADDNSTSSEFEAQADENGSASGSREAPSAQEVRDEFNAVLGELRSELAQLQLEEARDRMRTWIRENPLLAVFLAAGAGLLSGRLIAKALKPAPPPPLSERARRQIQALRERAERAASEMGHDVSERVSRARRQAEDVGREAAREAARRAGETGEKLSRRARDWSALASERAAALQEQAADRLAKAKQSASEQVEEATERAKASAEDVSESAKNQTRSWGSSLARNVAKTVAAGWIAKKIGTWIRR